MVTRRTFLGVMAGAVVACAARVPSASAAPSGVDPHDVAARYADRTPSAWGTSLPGIVTSFATSSRQLALTFDLCDRACDETLLDTLTTVGAPAVLFVCSKWIDDNPGRLERLAGNPLFDIGNHGTRHVPLSVSGRSAYGIGGTRSPTEAVDEVWSEQTRLATLLGRAPQWYRTGTAHYDDVGVQIVRDLGLVPVGFSVNADAGATAPASAVRSALTGAAPGSIVLAHANHPESGTAAGVGAALPAMEAAGWEFVSLAGQSVS